MSAVNSETIDMLGGVSTNTIAGLLLKIGNMRTRAIRGVQPVNRDRCRFVGPAFTVRYVPVREDLTESASLVSPTSHLAGTLDNLPRGCVMVFDMMRDETSGCVGDVLMARMIVQSVAAVVCDGGMRDTSAIARMAMPVWCAATAPPPSARSLMAADVQTMIACGGVMVKPGDIVVGDEDGVAVIPAHLAEEVARKGVEQERVEAWIRRKVERGAKLAGLYPPREETQAAYRAWVAAGSPKEG
jgi:regulator of RNase E activity RraA